MRNWDEDFDDEFYYEDLDDIFEDEEDLLYEIGIDLDDFDDLFSEESLEDFLESVKGK